MFERQLQEHWVAALVNISPPPMTGNHTVRMNHWSVKRGSMQQCFSICFSTDRCISPSGQIGGKHTASAVWCPQRAVNAVRTAASGWFCLVTRPRLIQSLKDSDHVVRRSAAVSLGRIGLLVWRESWVWPPYAALQVSSSLLTWLGVHEGSSLVSETCLSQIRKDGLV